MKELINSPETMVIFLLTLISLFIMQVFILIKIRSLLQNISNYAETISKFFFKFGLFSTKSELEPKTCQFCKFRLSYIHMGKNEGEVEDFYYKCKLHNVEVRLNDTCDRFESDRII
jgi:hypothetical protein